MLEVTTAIDQQLANGAALSNRLMIGTIVIGLALSLITHFGARRVTGPLSGTVARMTQLADGDTEIDLKDAARRDEIGDMANAVQIFRDRAIGRERLESQRRTDEEAVSARTRQIDSLKVEFEQGVASGLATFG